MFLIEDFGVHFHTGVLSSCVQGLLVLIEDKLLAQGQLAAKLLNSGWVLPSPPPPPPFNMPAVEKTGLTLLKLWPGKSIACQHGIADSRREAGCVSFLAGSFAPK